jgi:hypothetical protein
VTTINAGFGRLLAGVGGVLLLASLFMPWIDVSGGGSRNGWELLSAASEVLFVIVGVLGIAAAITGGRYGFFRPDVSLNGAADILGVVASLVLGWLLLFDFPSGGDAAVGVYLALVGAIVVATGAGDFRPPALFAKLPDDDRA